MAVDMVNHPPHYTNRDAKCPKCGQTIEAIDVTETFNFCLGNAVKYIWRADSKNGLEDLKKARWYIDREIAKREGKSENQP